MREDWIESRIGEILLIERGGSPRPIKEFITKEPNGINWIKIGDTIKGSKYITSTEEKIKVEGLKKTRIVEPGDFVLSNSMSFGRPFIMGIKGAIHDGWLALRNPNSIFDTDFLYYSLSSPNVYSQFDKLATGSTVRNLNSELVAKVIVSIPPFPEQRAIVKKLESLLSSLDAGVADLKKAQQQLKIYRQAVLRKAFDINAPAFKLFEICEEMFAGGDKPKDFFSEEKNSVCNVPIFANAVKDKGLYGFTKNARVTKNAITIAGRGSGTGYVEIRNEPFLPIVRLIVLVPKTKLITLKFLYFFLKNFNIEVSGSAIPQLTIPMIKDYQINIPLIKKQNEIVKQIESRLSVCDSIEQNIKESLVKAEALRQSILKKAFEGNLLTAQELAECKQAADYEPAGLLLERIKADKIKK